MELSSTECVELIQRVPASKAIKGHNNVKAPG